MGSLNDRRTADEAVDPLRKYETEDQDKGTFKTRATMALIIGSAVGLLKNILFPDDQGQARAAQVATADVTMGLAMPEDETGAGEPPMPPLPMASPRSSTSSPEYPAPDADGRSHAGRTASVSGSGPQQPNAAPRPHNDNEVLYGTKPGSNITAFAGALRESAGDSVGIAISQSTGGGVLSSDAELQRELDTAAGGPRGADPDANPDDTDPQGRPNRPSVVAGPVRLNGLLANQSIVVALSDLLSRASDPDGDRMTVRDLTASSGSLRDNGNNSWTFTPARDDASGVTFTYIISDGEAGIRQMAFLDLLPIPPSNPAGQQGDPSGAGTGNAGTPANGDVAPGGDLIQGSGSHDRIFAGGGDDVVYAGAGNDVVYGGMGDDRLYGEGGDDQLFGEAGDDKLDGGPGDDHLDGGPDDDQLFGEIGDDTLEGGIGDDELDGGPGDDALDGGIGADTLSGGTGDDELVGGPGEDDISAGSGSDLARATIGDGDDSYDGGADIDTYDLSGTAADAVVDLSTGTAASLDIGDDHISGFENIVGGQGDDVIIADDETNVLTGGPGDDVFVFRSTLSAGKGAGSRDKILDFEVGDKIDLDDIDREAADTLEDQGFRRFVLIRDGDAFTAPGQIRFAYEQFEDHEITIVAGNTDDDPDVEFEIELYGHKDLKDDDFSRHDS